MNNDIKECREALLRAFPNSFINENDEFIAEKRSNQYIVLKDCREPIDIECKVLEWFSRPASKGQPFSQEWRNKKYRKFMLDGINDFLDTEFTEDDMEDVYDKLGNAINHDLSITFIQCGYNMDLLDNNQD